MSRSPPELTIDLILNAYRAGLFPMAEHRDDLDLHWIDPPRRGILPLDRFHLPRRLARTVRAHRFSVGIDQDFASTLHRCAEARPDRPQTWINPAIEHAFQNLHQAGYAHSVECRLDGQLVGGLYGIALGGAFFGESMFSSARDASKVALVHLVARLRLGGFSLLDTQFLTEHLAQFGAVEIPRAAYRIRLAQALRVPARFPISLPPETIRDAITALCASSPNREGHIS